jgi:hypothetical protein
MGKKKLFGNYGFIVFVILAFLAFGVATYLSIRYTTASPVSIRYQPDFYRDIAGAFANAPWTALVYLIILINTVIFFFLSVSGLVSRIAKKESISLLTALFANTFVLASLVFVFLYVLKDYGGFDSTNSTELLALESAGFPALGCLASYIAIPLSYKKRGTMAPFWFAFAATALAIAGVVTFCFAEPSIWKGYDPTQLYFTYMLLLVVVGALFTSIANIFLTIGAYSPVPDEGEEDDEDESN